MPILLQENFINPVYTERDTTLVGQQNKVISCHHNQYSQWKNNLALQALGEFSNTHADPLLNRIAGLCIEGNGLVTDSDPSLISKNHYNHFLFYPYFVQLSSQ